MFDNPVYLTLLFFHCGTPFLPCLGRLCTSTIRVYHADCLREPQNRTRA
jgi:hypothetical protein